MKKFLKITAVVAGLAIASVSSVSADQFELEAPAEGCKSSGQCGTTPGGVKLNGSWSL